MTSTRSLMELTMQECRRLLPTARVGRLAFTDEGQPAILPVNFLLDGDDVVIRTGRSPKLAAAERGDILAFEVDEIDCDTRTGWSVLVVGRASVVGDIDELVALVASARRPWVSGPKEYFVRIRGDQITGRRLNLG